MKTPLGDAQAIKSKNEQDAKLRAEFEEKQRKAQILRLDYTLGLLDLGLDESLGIDYAPEGIFPRVRLHKIEEVDAAAAREQLTKLRSDLIAMGSAPSGLLGSDGAPIK